MCENTPSKMNDTFHKSPCIVITGKNKNDLESKCVDTGSTTDILKEILPENNLVTMKEKRCNLKSCNKKLLLGTRLKCRCGHVFCAQHLYSDDHNCVINYKEIQQKWLRDSMPKTDFCKLDKI